MPSGRRAVMMMSHRVAMTVSMSMTTLCKRRVGQRETGRNDQRRGERKFLHHVLQWGERTCPFK
jgi:hypothetical protein